MLTVQHRGILIVAHYMTAVLHGCISLFNLMLARAGLVSVYTAVFTVLKKGSVKKEDSFRLNTILERQ